MAKLKVGSITGFLSRVSFFSKIFNSLKNEYEQTFLDSNNFDAVTALCKLRRLDGQGFCCGTFGKRLMVYSVKGKKCKRVWTREFRNPILQIRSFDIVSVFF